jgi:DNA-binding response OmpR family regulator
MTLMEAEPPFEAVLAEPEALDGEGLEWLRQLRIVSWGRPVSVVLCFAPKAATMDRALESGARHFIFKPYASAAIAAKLRQIAQVRSDLHSEPVGLRS